MKVLIPDMPTADDLLPYLRRIDEARVYTNHGPLVQELTAKLADLVRAPCAVVSNATVALELALRALKLPPGSQVAVPAATFRATGMAILNAGLTPALCDVDPSDWHMQPSAAFGRNRNIRAAMPVATFGDAIWPQAWIEFARHWEIPVVIDAAGALLSQPAPSSNLISVVYSLHATKAIGASEGGVFASRNAMWGEHVARAANFGYGGDDVGTNAKLSEYHAAVALASLRQVAHKVGRALVLHDWYAKYLPQELVTKVGASAGRTLLPVLMPDFERAAAARQAFKAAGIETRQWYAPFLHELPLFASCPRLDDLAFTHQLAARLIGLPFHHLLTEADVRRVCDVLAGAIANP